VAQKEGLLLLGKIYIPLKKRVAHFVGITVVFIHAIDVKFGPPLKMLRSAWCPKLVTLVPPFIFGKNFAEFCLKMSFLNIIHLHACLNFGSVYSILPLRWQQQKVW